jgi:hypothetical protein
MGPRAMSSSCSRLLSFPVLGLALIVSAPAAHAADRAAAKGAFQPPGARATLTTPQARQAVGAYAEARGFRPDKVGVTILGASKSGKSTNVVLDLGGRAVPAVIHHGTGQLHAPDPAKLTAALFEAHVPYTRVGLGKSSRFATSIVEYRPGAGSLLPAHGLSPAAAPLGRPRANMAPKMIALDALPLDGGQVTLELNHEIIAGRPGAGLIVRENGLPNAMGNIINQTPGRVEVMANGAWYVVGYAGYKAAGDKLLLSDAINPIPSGATITRVRISDDPTAPHPQGFDPTDNAVAARRGVKGFDLVSVEGLPGDGAAVRRAVSASTQARTQASP